MNSTLSTFNTTTEVPLSKAPNPQLLPGLWSNGCPLLRVRVHSVCSLLTAVCVHLDGLNAEHQFRVWVTILDNTSLLLLYKSISVLVAPHDVLSKCNKKCNCAKTTNLLIKAVFPKSIISQSRSYRPLVFMVSNLGLCCFWAKKC